MTINLTCSIFEYIGVAIFVLAIIQFVLATKRSDADAKESAFIAEIWGIALIGIANMVPSLLM